MKTMGMEINYPTFLATKPNWFKKLISCPTCVIPWLNFIGFAIFKLNPLALGVMIIASWIGYFSVVKVIKKLNE